MANIWQGHGERNLVEKIGDASWLAVAIAAAIGGIGVMTLFSVAGGSMQPWAATHLGRLVAGFFVVLVIAVLPIRLWMALAYPIFALALGCLIAVEFAGVTAGGAQRWLDLGPLTFQPSELMKGALILALARFYQRLPPWWVSHPLALLACLTLVVVPAGLIAMQPDLGTAVLITAIGLGVIFLSGVNLFYVLGGIGIVGAVLPFAWGFLHQYQQHRILMFLDPDQDPLGRGYQVLQSKIALGAGGLSGQGFLNGSQAQLDFVPEKHTDFIFTTFGEELGFVGGVILLALFAALFVCLLVMAVRCRSVFGRLVTAGFAIALFGHVAVNLAMVMGAAPVVGVPLPLVSYGGTSMLTTLGGLGLALNAYIHRREQLSHREFGWLS